MKKFTIYFSLTVLSFLAVSSVNAQYIFATDNATNSPYTYGQSYDGENGATSPFLGTWISIGTAVITNSPAGSSSFGVTATTNTSDVSTASRPVTLSEDNYISYQFGYNGLNASGEYSLALGNLSNQYAYNLFYNPSGFGSHWLFNDGSGNVDTGVTATSGAQISYNFSRISSTQYTVTLSGSGSWSRTAAFGENINIFSIEATQSGAGNVIGANNFVVGSVPEPSSWALLGFGAFVVIAVSLRRKNVL